MEGEYKQKTTDFNVDLEDGPSPSSCTEDGSRGILFNGITYKVNLGLIKKTTKIILDDVS